MGQYPGFNGLPFRYLIDAEFVFLPPVSQCLPIDIYRYLYV